MEGISRRDGNIDENRQELAEIHGSWRNSPQKGRSEPGWMNI
jgi:hypothetical protein